MLIKSGDKIYSLKKKEILHETKMTSDTAPAPFVASASSVHDSSASSVHDSSASSVHDSSYPAWKAFNGTNISNTDCWVTAINIKTGWIQLDFGSKKSLNCAYVSSRNHTDFKEASPKDFNILGSSDGINFEVLAEIRNQTDWGLTELRKFPFKKVSNNRYLKLEVLDNNGKNFTAIGNIIYSYIENLTQLPSDSVENFIKYGSPSIENFNLINGSKNYILQDGVSENADGLWIQEIDRKPLSIKLE